MQHREFSDVGGGGPSVQTRACRRCIQDDHRKSMLGGPMYSLMSSQIFECDEPFAADGADLSPGAMPASVVALNMSAS